MELHYLYISWVLMQALNVAPVLVVEGPPRSSQGAGGLAGLIGLGGLKVQDAWGAG